MPVSVAYKNSCAWPRDESAGRGRTFESCRAHGLTKPFLSAPNAEKCTIRPSYSASAPAGEGEKPRPEGARGEGVLGQPDRGAGGLGAAEDGVLQDRSTARHGSASSARFLSSSSRRPSTSEPRLSNKCSIRKCRAPAAASRREGVIGIAGSRTRGRGALAARRRRGWSSVSSSEG
jgi:hypothetical protein